MEKFSIGVYFEINPHSMINTKADIIKNILGEGMSYANFRKKIILNSEIEVLHNTIPNTKAIMDYLDMCVKLRDNGITHGIELIRHDINNILNAKSGDIIQCGSIISKTTIKIE